MQILIVGAGLGGLSCAISCRKAGLDATVLEQSPEISEIGAGIQVPPNAFRVMRHLGLLPQVKAKGTRVEWQDILSYRDGGLIIQRLLGDDTVEELGGQWLVIHRADYHAILLEEAKRLGVNILLSAKVTELDVENTKVHLEDGREFSADVIVGADGLWSQTRTTILDKPSPPYETGDLAYRATFPRESLLALNEPRINELVNGNGVTLWAGPGGHSVFYPVKNGTVFNLVLLRPDNMPAGTRTAQGDIGEMRATFEKWDPVLTKIISCIPTVLKWKLLHHEELESWTKNNITILGDACHPTLPYQAQGAAMAVEDGALLGVLLGEFNKRADNTDKTINGVLKLYESMRKPRTTLNVKGALNNRDFYHMVDGPEQEERDASFKGYDWSIGESKFAWANVKYQKDLLRYDVLADGRERFAAWIGEAESRL
ncbi:hypothetical protein N7474_008316 [Penicillium riverlandense]|uniref:uncharacterized protein n=1 Tax=Penicillium riverlandense TaxID=1903569 RepID=UPI00254778A2|nr:uncharacterized protein N7474_008316 [Penicillium riverlandense]KAJ5812015.1 hypothetical protein N7474_008316 [Penicillium riverlandense]